MLSHTGVVATCEFRMSTRWWRCLLTGRCTNSLAAGTYLRCAPAAVPPEPMAHGQARRDTFHNYLPDAESRNLDLIFAEPKPLAPTAQSTPVAGSACVASDIGSVHLDPPVSKQNRMGSSPTNPSTQTSIPSGSNASC
jgi:hypothetical protein